MGYMKPTGSDSGKRVSGPRSICCTQPAMKLTAAFLVLGVALLSHRSECSQALASHPHQGPWLCLCLSPSPHPAGPNPAASVPGAPGS